MRILQGMALYDRGTLSQGALFVDDCIMLSPDVEDVVKCCRMNDCWALDNEMEVGEV